MYLKKIGIFLFILFSSFTLSGEQKQTICLNMIVKNESKVITRCLQSVKPFIDYWVIVDTGSSDGTQKIITDFMKDIPGELHESPWKNFEHNRNEALAFAKNKADYILFIDADEQLIFASNFVKPYLDKDFYFIMTEFGGSKYQRVQLVNNRLDWKWTGVLHEAIDCSWAKTSELLKGVVNLVTSDGCRSQDPQKFQKDAKTLEDALQTEPNNSRYVFYLAQSYRDANEYALAIKNYEKRIAMEGWDQEIFWSMFQIARMQEALKMPEDTFINSYYKAYSYRPTRIEPLYYLISYYRSHNKHLEGYILAKLATKLPVSDDALFVESWIYEYGLPLELSLCAYELEKYDEAAELSFNILAKTNLPEIIRKRVEENIKWIYAKMFTPAPVKANES